LIGCNHDLMLKAKHVPMLLLFQQNPLHHLTDFMLNLAIIWIVRWPQEDRECLGLI
jgi:hypothetical protein